MKTIKKNVYYCDHCKKKSLAKHAMGVHEKHCTANPNRVCRVCDNLCISDTINEFKARFTWSDEPEFDSITGAKTGRRKTLFSWVGDPVTLEEIRKEADNCPACTLAILRQCNFFHFNVETENFDFKSELAQAMKEKVEENYGRVAENYGYH